MTSDRKDIKVGSLIKITDYYGNSIYDIVSRIFCFCESNPIYFYCCLKPGKAYDPKIKDIKLIQ